MIRRYVWEDYDTNPFLFLLSTILLVVTIILSEDMFLKIMVGGMYLSLSFSFALSKRKELKS